MQICVGFFVPINKIKYYICGMKEKKHKTAGRPKLPSKDKKVGVTTYVHPSERKALREYLMKFKKETN